MHPVSHSSGSCFHCLEGGCKTNAHINFNTDVKPTVEHLFEMLFFKPFIMGTIIPQLNKSLQEDRHCPLAYGEFLHWLSFWFLMATINGPDKVEFWYMGEVDYFVGAPMSFRSYKYRKCFKSILKVLSFTSQERPVLMDHFREVHEILKAWNSNMVEQFTPSWVRCLDKSMSTWTNKYSCPGWMFVPEKPWSFGNEYHMVCCSISGILYQKELVKGKDAPSQVIPKFNNLGQTVGLLRHVLEPLF